jgi:NACalpha-BTF3-like transcription factor
MTERLLLIKDDKILDCKKICLQKLNTRFIDKFNKLPSIVCSSEFMYRYVDVSNTDFRCWKCVFKRYCVRHSPPNILDAEGIFLEEDVKLLMSQLPNVSRYKIIKSLAKNNDLVETILNINNY